MKKYKIKISEERHAKELESLGSVFMPMVKGAISSEDLVGVDIILNWREIVGNTISNFCFPLKTKVNPRDNCRTLYLEVPAGGYALEIQHKTSYLLNKINAYFGYTAIHKLNVAQNMTRRPIDFMAEAPSPKKAEITEEDKNYLQQVVNEIKNENLREILIKIGKNIISDQKE